MRVLNVTMLGEVPYEAAWDLQRRLHTARVHDEIADTLLLLSHPPTLTAGRADGRADVWASLRQTPAKLQSRGVALVETDRGGDLTYHGPGQRVAYLIAKLEPGQRDVGRFVDRLEEAMLLFLAKLGVAASRDRDHRGVWIGHDKIGAVGARLASWTSTHGVSINVRGPLEGFGWIVPCGLTDRGITAVDRVVPAESLPGDDALDVLMAEAFGDAFERPVAWIEPGDLHPDPGQKRQEPLV